MRATALLLVVLAVAVAGCGSTKKATPPPPPPAPRFTAAVVSSNWSGYVVRRQGGGFTHAAASWRMPRIACAPGPGSSAAFWVGLGGFGNASASLQQLGASADCSPAGKTAYGLWTEIVPAAAHFLSLRVMPGDVITASVSVKSGVVSFALANATRRTRYATSVKESRRLDVSSAEWIAEAPSICRTVQSCQVIPLSNYGRVTFTGISAAAGGQKGALGGAGWSATPVALVSSNNASRFISASNPSGSVPGKPTAHGTSFPVGYRASLPGVARHPLPGAPLPPWVH